MKIVGVIPARYQSSRFPGKPLVDICGKPMIWWVYQEAKKADVFDEIIIATEDERVIDICNQYGLRAMITSNSHPTGTDRAAEIAQKVTADYYVIIMGDEPLISYKDEIKIVEEIYKKPKADAIMLAEKFKNPVDVVNTTTIKLAISDSGRLLFMSRSPVPYPKASLEYFYYKNVGCYAMKKEILDFFLNSRPGYVERVEEIELLRLLENGKYVSVIKIDSDSMAVDTPKDLERICKIMERKTTMK